MTIPWFGLWAAWIDQLVETIGRDIAPGSSIQVPLFPRLVIAVMLLAFRRPLARGLAAIIAIPTFYWVSWILLLGLVPRPAATSRL